MVAKVLLIAGARPNFMKVAPIYAEMKRRTDEFDPKIVHTGQHYDAAMSDAFFDDLGMPRPDVHLGVGFGISCCPDGKDHDRIRARRAEGKARLGAGCRRCKFDHRLRTCLLEAWVKVAHVESGLRSGDRTMPEEINRILTDAISDLLFTTSQDADANLEREGISKSKIRFVGNVMIDSLMDHLKLAERSRIREDLGVSSGEYAVLTLHRPSNVDVSKLFRAYFRRCSKYRRCCQ
jgi:UDP-N-acetylglucosamine 2-epimerase (non-hydrolysing)